MILTAIFRDGEKPKKINFRTLDYMTHEEQANELARKLRERGIKRPYKKEWRFEK